MDAKIKKISPSVNKASKKIWYFIIAGVVLIIAIAVCLGYFYYLDKKKEETPLTAEEEIELQKEVIGIVKTNDFNKCQKVKNQLYKTVCVNNIALNLAKEKQDINYCQRLDDKLLSIVDCEKQIISAKSQNKEDINVCNETKNIEIQKECKNNFWLALVFKKEDVALCNNITAEKEKNFCHDNYLLQKEFIISREKFDCQRLNDQETKIDCQFYKESILSEKIFDCNNFKSGLFLNYCLFNQ